MRKILIVIDMQNDFIDGALGTKEACGIVDNVIAKAESYAKDNIVATMDTHGDNYSETQEGRNLPVPHCIKGTDGWKINEKLSPHLAGVRVYEKPGFGSPALVEHIKELAAKEEIEIEMVGLCTDICVVTNALMIKGALPEVPICVDAACCAGVTPESHEHALFTMASCQIQINR